MTAWKCKSDLYVLQMNSANGLFTAELTVGNEDRMVGHFGYQLVYKDLKGDLLSFVTFQEKLKQIKNKSLVATL